jgi:hypothetical protein
MGDPISTCKYFTLQSSSCQESRPSYICAVPLSPSDAVFSQFVVTRHYLSQLSIALFSSHGRVTTIRSYHTASLFSLAIPLSMVNQFAEELEAVCILYRVPSQAAFSIT